MPTPCTSEDAHMLLHKKYDSDIDLKIFGKFLVATKFVQSCCDLFLPLLKEKAMQVRVWIYIGYSYHSKMWYMCPYNQSVCSYPRSGKANSPRDNRWLYGRIYHTFEWYS